jgi:hypothetical protein
MGWVVLCVFNTNASCYVVLFVFITNAWCCVVMCCVFNTYATCYVVLCVKHTQHNRKNDRSLWDTRAHRQDHLQNTETTETEAQWIPSTTILGI